SSDLTLDGVVREGMAKGVLKKETLPEIEVGGDFEQLLASTDLLVLVLEMSRKPVEGLFDDIEFVEHEVREIAVVELGVEIGLGISGKALADDLGNGEVLKDPVS